MTVRILHPVLALIASATDSELAKYVEYLKEENRILRARIPQQVHTRRSERERLLKLARVLGRAIEEVIAIVPPATFNPWGRDEKDDSGATNPKGGRKKPREVLDLVLQIDRTTNFGDTPIIGELRTLSSERPKRQGFKTMLQSRHGGKRRRSISAGSGYIFG